MNTILNDLSWWIIPQLTFTLLTLIEVSKRTERCIYKDFGDIELHFSSENMTLSTLLSATQCSFDKHDYKMSDILKAGRWLSVMRTLCIILGIIMLILLLLPSMESIQFMLREKLNVHFLITTFIWPILIILDAIILFLRISSSAVRILKKLHKDYKEIRWYSILIFKYYMK